MAKLSEALQRKLEFYRTAGTGSMDVALTGRAKKKALGFVRTTALDKIKGVSLSVKEEIRQALLLAQSTGQPLVGAASTILGATKLEKGAFATSRKRAIGIARNELRAARQYALTEDAAENGVVYFTWISLMTKGTCPICAGRHGTTHTLRVWKRIGLPPSPHYNCACSLIPGRGIPIPRGITRSQVRKLGVKARIFRQVKESDYLRMRKQFIKDTNDALGI